MKKYKSRKEFKAKIKDNLFYSQKSIDISAFDLEVKADIKVEGDIFARNISAGNIDAGDIRARDISAGNIDAGDIFAGDIYAKDIKARNIDARNIDAWDIKVKDIFARNISAGNIKAEVVSYFAVAFAYKNIKVKSIEGRRKNAKHFVLDGKKDKKEKEDEILCIR